MTPEELGDAMDGLYAYDEGATDSGIHNEALRQRVITELQAMDSKWLSRWIRDAMLSEEALEQGYGIADVRSFLEWLRDRMDCDV